MQQRQGDQGWLDEFLTSFAATFGKNIPRMAARMLGALLVTDREELSSHDLIDVLGASPAAVSNSGRLLLRWGIVERRVSPETRRDHYRLRDDTWVRLFRDDELLVKATAALLDEAIAHPSAVTGAAIARVREMRDFYDFLSQDIPNVVDRYEQWRAESRRDEA